MSTYPVYGCRHCGRPVVFNDVQTFKEDASGELLAVIMKGLKKIAVCPDCRKREAYNQQTGNTDFRLGEVSEHKRIIYPSNEGQIEIRLDEGVRTPRNRGGSRTRVFAVKKS